MTEQVFALAGPLGCGKSTAAEMIADIIRHDGKFAQITEMSNFVRSEYNAYVGTESVDDNALGEWAAKRKEADGDGCFAHDLAVLHEDDGVELIVSGIRSPAEIDALEDVYGAENVTTLAIWTLPELRFKRKYGDTMHAQHEQFDTFMERNDRELSEWGCEEIYIDDDTDFVIANNEDEINLQRQLLIAVDSVYGTILKNPLKNPFEEMKTEHVRSFL
jgi:dephospho-CoA kinase